MIRLRRWAVSLAVGLWLSTSAMAADDDRLSLAYDVYMGGLKIIDFGLDLDLKSEAYAIRSTVKTVGFIGWLMPWSQVAVSEGTLAGLETRPLRHRTEGKFRDRPRLVEIDYRDGHVVNVVVMPPPVDDGGRDVVPDEMRRGTRDPMSTILAALRQLDESGSCSRTLPVYDGRRRYDLIFTDRGGKMLQASSYGRFSGAAQQCDFEYVPLRGHERRNPDPATQARQLRKGRTFLANVLPGATRTPVRIEVDGDWGDTVAHLRQFQRVAREATPNRDVASITPAR
jgi:hypothetical protein